MERLEVLGDRIYQARVKARLTQQDVAEYVGITQGSVSFIEQGRRNCSVATLLAIADACDVDPAELVRGLHRAQGAS